MPAAPCREKGNALSISIEHNDDRSITVSCGDEKIRVYPKSKDPTPKLRLLPPISLTGVVLPPALLQPLGGKGVPVYEVTLDDLSGEPTFDFPALKRFAGEQENRGAVYLNIKALVGQQVKVEALTKRIEGYQDLLDQPLVPFLTIDDD
jgi:hypothetical protein